MTLSPVQSGASARRDSEDRWLPDTVGSTEICLNMRERLPGRLEAVGLPHTVGFLAAEPVCTDTRDTRTYIFTQTADHTLAIEGWLRLDGEFEPARTEFGRLPGAVTHAAVCGQFLVLTVNDAPLHYLLWNPDTLSYTMLGQMPEAPAFTAYVTSAATCSADIAPVGFGGPVADLRQTIPSAVRTPLEKAVKDAYHEAVAAVEAAGLFLQPVLVRLAVRLWDGSLLHLSAPQLVCGPTPFTTGDVTMVPLVKDSAGFTATSRGAFQLTGYRVRVDIADHDLGRWADVVRGIEVWVSTQAEAIDPARQVEMTHRQIASGYFMAVQVSRLTDAQLTARTLQNPWMRQLTLAPSASGKVSVKAGKRPVVPDPFARVSRLCGMRAAVAAGHGDFLHLADVTYRHPEVPLPAGVTPDSDGPVSLELGVTLSSGGARGIVATHKVKQFSNIGPLVWYPSAAASMISVRATAADGSQSGLLLPLTPAPGGEDAAYYLHDDLNPIPLEEGYLPPLPIAMTEERHPAEVLTMAPGNPFVAVGQTRYCGSTVRALAPQIRGGGAYTRQYIYAMTDTGITALTHDPAGRHTNHRPIAPDRATRRGAVCSTATGVYVLTDAGALLRLRDALAATLFSGLPSFASLAWSGATSELWIIPDPGASASPGRALVVQTLADFRAYLRSDVPLSVLTPGPLPLFVTPPPKGLKSYTLWTPDAVIAPDADRLRSDILWISAPQKSQCRGRAIAAFGVEGQGVLGTLTVSAAAPGSRWDGGADHPSPLLMLAVQGDAFDHVESPLMLPALPAVTTYLRWRVEGRIARLTGTKLMHNA